MTSIIEKLSKLLKILGDQNRLGIVLSIGKHARSVTELINITGLSQTLVSFHLRALRDADIVVTERKGPFIYYSLFEPDLIDILNDLFHAVNSRRLTAKKKNKPTLDKELEKQRR